MKLSVPEHIQSLRPYKPGKPIGALQREYGIRSSVKLASNENPLGPSPAAVEAIRKASAALHRYPDGGGYELVGKIAETFSLQRDRIVLGAGSDDIIGMLARALLQAGDEVVIPYPSFLMYEIEVRSSGAKPVMAPLKNFSIDVEGILDRVGPKTRMVFLCNPNNPTGSAIDDRAISHMLQALPEGVVAVIDEAYIEFVRDPGCTSRVREVNDQTPLVVMRTFSKAYGLAGLRIGYGVMPASIADLLHRVRQPFNASVLAQVGAAAALEDQAFVRKSVALAHEGIDFLRAELSRRGIRSRSTQANFFLIDVQSDADSLFERMLREGVIVRSMAEYGYPTHIRINAGLPEENERFLAALDKVMGCVRRPDDDLLIAIDGPAGAGKTTVSRMLASRLGYRYVDTGALYRAVALAAIRRGVSADDDGALTALFRELHLDYRWAEEGRARVFIDGEEVTDKIRAPEVTRMASDASARSVVRERLMGIQRRLGEGKRVVFEGRDMGTVVFPEADVKFFLEASLSTRARRRFEEMPETTQSDPESVENEMARRDENDSTRTLAPLKAAEDAVHVDSTHLTADQVVERMMRHIRRRQGSGACFQNNG